MNETNEPLQLTPQYLATIPGKALTFLYGVGRNTEIFTLLTTRGYTNATHEAFWQRLRDAGGLNLQAATGTLDPRVSAALKKVDDWDEGNFAVASASLQFAFPAQHAFVFAGDLKPGKGADAVVAVGTFLERLRQLRESPEREATRVQDHAALARLAERGITEPICRELSAAVSTIEHGTTLRTERSNDSDQERRLMALYELWKEWSTIARAVLTRRSHLIAVGLLERKPRKVAPRNDKNKPAESPAPVVTKPVAPAAPVAAPVVNRGVNGHNSQTPPPA